MLIHKSLEMKVLFSGILHRVVWQKLADFSVSTSETSANYQNTRRNIPENNRLHQSLEKVELQ
jgi:hypothetical protein